MVGFFNITDPFPNCQDKLEDVVVSSARLSKFVVWTKNTVVNPAQLAKILLFN